MLSACLATVKYSRVHRRVPSARQLASDTTGCGQYDTCQTPYQTLWPIWSVQPGMGSGDCTDAFRDTCHGDVRPLWPVISYALASPVACWSDHAPAAQPRLVRCSHLPTPWHGEHQTIVATGCVARGPVAVRPRRASREGGLAVRAVIHLAMPTSGTEVTQVQPTGLIGDVARPQSGRLEGTWFIVIVCDANRMAHIVILTGSALTCTTSTLLASSVHFSV